ncbi:MAG: bifunctional DNA-formamidopyrimidine glycosylase/DNA-(apurinic or apyrimidinic site) lyase [bacterium]|nr:bifunctional DNA-formamidopyrimidine glycosylase/DNA-(apurinic or apyrimidinic site) lyase [bacterium]
MPELPEVETIIKGLKKNILSKTISKVNCLYYPIVKKDINEFINTVTNQSIKNISRHGKYIFVWLSNGKTIVIHLRMTGQLFFSSKNSTIDKHTHMEIYFSNSDTRITYRDIRKFGRFEIIKSSMYDNFIKTRCLAPDALSIDIDAFHNNITRKKGSIKAAILNQSVVAGIGNIYADEILNMSHISPKHSTRDLTKKQIAVLLKNIKYILKKAISKNGTTFSDYISSDGTKGSYQFELRAYMQENRPCKNCPGSIIKDKVAGRGTYYCPGCQK